MRKSTILWFFLATICGYSLFYVSERTRDIRSELSSVVIKKTHEEENIRVLKAEWSYLNQPKRLERLAREHLKTNFVKINQFVKIKDISSVELLSKNMSMPIRIKPSISKKIIIRKKLLIPPLKRKVLTVKSKRGFINMLHFWGRE